MFGYIRPDISQLTVENYQIYRGYYCGLCKTIGKMYGQIPRLALQYDLGAMALMIDGVNESGTITRGFCMLHPLSRRPVAHRNAALEYAAGLNVILAYHNLLDDWADEKKILSKAAADALRLCYKKAAKRLPQQNQAIMQMLAQLHTIEQANCNDMEAAAEPFATVMQELFMHAPDIAEGQRAAWGYLGRHLGRWTYLIDAFADMEKDFTQKHYNPLIAGVNLQNSSIIEYKQSQMATVRMELMYSLAQSADAIDVITLKRHRPIAENIVLQGLVKTTETVLLGRSKESVNESI